MRCKIHPNYQPTRAPRKTVAYPNGCSTCLNIWEEQKNYVKNTLSTLNIELTDNEARKLLRALKSVTDIKQSGKLISVQTSEVLMHFYLKLLHLIRR